MIRPIPTLAALVLPSLAVLALTAPPARAADLERPPYLQLATPTSITVVWTTLADSTGAIEYGPAPDRLGTMVPSAGAGTQHEVTLDGLTPSTRYYYRVLGDGAPLAGGDDQHTFRTPPPVGPSAKFRAWIVGDSGTGDNMQALVRDAMVQHAGVDQPHLYLHMGDMAYSDGTYDEFTDNFYLPYQDVLRNTPVWPTMGNHKGHSSDSRTQTGPYYGSYVLPTAGQAVGLASRTEAYYSFDYAHVHFVVLDSHDSDRSPGGPMLTWLANDLMSTNQEWIIAYWHHPPYTKGSHDSDTEGQLVDMRENALPVLEAGGVDLVLGGHSHIYERTYLLDGAYQTPSQAGVGVLDASDGRVDGDGPYPKPPGLSGHQGAVYVVAGHGGTGVSQDDVHPLVFFDEVANGSCLLDVQGNRLSLINVRFDGEITDRVAILKGDGVMIDRPDGGESLSAGQVEPIRWATVGTIPDVRLEYSIDGGQQWVVIEDSIPNTGSYDWPVPVVDTERALVRVSDASDPAVEDESNASFGISSQVPVTLVDFGHTWRYHDQGEDLGEAWLSADYDDSAWPQGPGQLGYGDGDEATVLLDADPNFPSAYFRTEVEIPIEGEVVGAEVTALFDDGVAVWVNGQQVFGFNVDDGLDYDTWASIDSDDNQIESAPVDPGVFIAGPNVITAMIKQSGEGSSDLSFDLRMVVTVMVEPPPGGDSTGSDSGSGGPLDGTIGSEGDGGSTGLGTSTGLTAGAADGGAGGCGCTSTGSGAGGWALGLLLLGWRRRRLDRR
ncbi:MAG: metallophosphoesterase family protein [Myxococcales bacterium]|nr:metallophosphoesterase family protein [Myxococcales bacterium]